MQPSRNRIDELVMKSVVFQEATGGSAWRRLHHEAHVPTSAGHRGASRLRSSRDEGPAAHRGSAPRSRISSEPATTAVPFTFHVPLQASASAPWFSSPSADATRGDASTCGQQQRQQQASLQQALRRHEDALRAWADAPLRDVPAPPPPPPQQSADSVSAEATPNNALDALPAGLPSRVTLAVVRPYCRVLARASVAGIGLPHHSPSKTTSAAATAAAVAPPTGPVDNESSQGSSQESSVRDGGYAASQSSLSDDAVHVPTVPRTTATAADAAAVTVAAPLLPYQLPLRMRCDVSVPSAQVPDASRVAGSVDGLQSGTTAFQQAQERRYATWRQQQAAVLQRLAPDMFGRRQPSFAVVEGAPHVMDGGLCNGASSVLRSRRDRGVVYV